MVGYLDEYFRAIKMGLGIDGVFLFWGEGGIFIHTNCMFKKTLFMLVNKCIF